MNIYEECCIERSSKNPSFGGFVKKLIVFQKQFEEKWNKTVEQSIKLNMNSLFADIIRKDMELKQEQDWKMDWNLIWGYSWNLSQTGKRRFFRKH